MDHLKQIEVITELFLKPVTIPSEADQPTSQVLENLFKSSLQTVVDRLNSDKDLEWLTAAVNAIMLNGPYEDTYWQFAEFGLKILLCFYEALKLAREKYRRAVSEDASLTEHMALPPDIISIQQQKDIQNILKFIVCLGISRNLLPGIGIPLHSRSKFANILLNNEWKPSDYNKHQMLFSTVCSLVKCASHPSLGSLIITKHFGDLLAALCQLCFAPLKKELPEGMTQSQENKYLKHLYEMEEDRRTCFKLLNTLVEKAFQPLVFHEILLLRGPPSNKSQSDAGSIRTPLWVKKAAQRLFAEGLMKKYGVQAGIQAILDSMGEDYTSNEWAKCDVAAQLIAGCCPKTSEEKFFEHVCPQILDLYDLKDDRLCSEYSRVASSVIKLMTVNQPSLSHKYLIKPLTRPLLVCSYNPETMDCLPTEEEFLVCITKLHQVFVVTSDPDEKFLEILFPVLGILLHINSFLNSSVSFLRHQCEELISRYLKCADVKIARRTITEWLFPFDGKSDMLLWNSYLTLQNGSRGGFIVTAFEVSKDDEHMWLEDDNSKVVSVIALLSQLRTDRIAVEFFLSILQELTSVTQEHPLPRSGHEHCSDASRELINIEATLIQNEYHIRKSLMIFHILSEFCEQSALQESIVQDQAQVINFVKIMLERGACLCKSTSDNSSIQTESILMAMTILSMTASGQDSAKSEKALKCCLPYLEVLSVQHPEKEVCQFAAELCISINTHGAVGMEGKACSTAIHARKLAVMKDLQKQQKKETTIASEKACGIDRPNEVSKYKQACNDVLDPEPALKGPALLRLGKLLASRDEETMRHKEKVLTIFMENLEHDDSYVYLMAIRGLAGLADVFADVVLPCLMSQYSRGGPTSSPELRMKLGEVLIKVTRVLGEIVPKYREPLLHVLLNATKDPDPYVRASSLSNLGEVCKELKYSLGSHIHEVFNCLTSLIKTDPSAEVRRAAINVITLIFQGLEKDSFKMLGYILKDVYRLLKLTYEVDKDEGVKFHARIALGELGNICTEYLFPPQTLEKKIKVLGPF